MPLCYNARLNDEKIAAVTVVKAINRQGRRVIKSAVIVIDMVSVQNPLAPFCSVLGKDRTFFLLGGLGKQF